MQPRTIAALQRAGFEAVVENGGDNPVYELEFAEVSSKLKCFSKLYDELPNPTNNFVAMLCCSDVDEHCPVIRGATARIGLHYRDPKYADSTSQEIEAYDQCCKEIATEMFFLASSLSDLQFDDSASSQTA